MNPLLSRFHKFPRGVVLAMTFGIMATVGLIDHATGYELSFSVFYLVAIAASFWLAGRGMAIMVSILSVGIGMLGDWVAGMHSSFILVWNGVITMTFYLIVLALLGWLKSSHETLEARIKGRTAALREEMAERERLEKEILRISENERQRIGCDLHDNLCQHLTGTAIAALNVEQDLADMGHESAAKGVRRLVDLVEEGISLAREIARGLAPLHLEHDGLTDSLEELATTTRNHLKTPCRFEYDDAARAADMATAVHLYRIAQEAVSNAVRHGKARFVTIGFGEAGGQQVLTIRDDGCGLAAVPQECLGMGLLIMKHRATMMGATLSVETVPEGGTVVTCTLNTPCAPTDSEHDVR